MAMYSGGKDLLADPTGMSPRHTMYRMTGQQLSCDRRCRELDQTIARWYVLDEPAGLRSSRFRYSVPLTLIASPPLIAKASYHRQYGLSTRTRCSTQASCSICSSGTRTLCYVRPADRIHTARFSCRVTILLSLCPIDFFSLHLGCSPKKEKKKGNHCFPVVPKPTMARGKEKGEDQPRGLLALYLTLYNLLQAAGW